MEPDIRKKAILEALIFSSKNGLSLNKLASIMEMKISQISLLIDELKKEYSSNDHGVCLKMINGKYIFYTKENVENFVKKIFQRPIAKITDSQMEVLSIVAVKGPILRSEIELIRGKSSQSQLYELVKMGLTRKNRSKLPGKPYYYKVTGKFFQTFQLNDMSGFLEEINIKLEDIKAETSNISTEEFGSVPEESGNGDN
jgi:segregation and condensation protein B